MRLFYEEYAYDERWQQLVAKLPQDVLKYRHLKLKKYILKNILGKLSIE